MEGREKGPQGGKPGPQIKNGPGMWAKNAR